MTIFYLIRHGDADYSLRDSRIYKGFGVNLSPLSEKGIQEIKTASKDIRLSDASLILSSPYTRALQSAAILSKELQIDIAVETNLHEWVADKKYNYLEVEEAEKNYQEFVELKGNYPLDGEKDWEDINLLRKRILSVLEKYGHYEKVIVVCHGMIIQSLSSIHPANAQILEYINFT